MKFNKLYLHGFKSFVDKTSVDFPDGITAIVGPNGSGKSNIMDAVRWVFGEQNAKELRGAEMEDVVFNGSQKRKAAGFAEVGLTLSDIDESIASKYGTFSDITITRKFYRTGEREYYINNRKCRLKDIKDIFMDTGLGARSISIIEQGKVDKIINAGPEELRFFLEETAGVTKFKDKKKEAERRLEQTRDNLNRVNDIVTEIVQRMDTLSAQVEVLKKSEELQSSKRALDKKYLASVYASKTGEHESQSERRLSVQATYESKLAEYAALVKNEAAANAEYSSLEEENKELQEKRLSFTKKVTKTEGEIESIRSKMQNSGKLKEQLESDIEKQTELYNKSVETKEILSDKKEMAEAAYEEASDKLSDIESVIEDIKSQKEQIEDEYSSANEHYLESTAELTKKRNELIRRESHEEHMVAAFERLKNEKIEIDKQAFESAAKKEQLELEYKSIATELENAEKLVIEVTEGKKEINAETERLRLTQSELRATLKALKSSAEFLERQLDESVGAPNELNALKKFAPRLLIDETGALPQAKIVEISDVLLFKDADKPEVMAIAAAMKSALRFTFENDFDTVIAMLDSINSDGLPDSIYETGGVYRKIGDDDKALKIIALRKRISEDAEKAAEATALLNETDARLFETEELATRKNAQLETAQKNMNAATSAATSLKSAIAAATSDSERGKKRAQTIDNEIRIATDDYESYIAATKILKQEVEDTGVRQLEAETSRADFEDKLENIENMLDEHKDEHHEIKVAMTAASERFSAAKNEIEANMREYANISENLEKLRSRLHTLVHIDEAMWKSDAEKLESLLHELNISLLSSEEELKTSEQKLQDLKSDIETLRNSADKCNSIIKETDEELRTLDIALASAQSYTGAIAAQYAEKFGEDLSVCYMQYADKDFQPKKTKDEIAQLETELESLGAINLNAVNDFSEAQERWDFLSSQRSDLEGSIADINAFIYDTDETTAKMFQDTYDSVKEKFIEVFQILFGNGEAELRLTDPENMLTTGVEIYIQPPGKRLQHMGLLSGGEKALTAMTLLFALFLQKPTPFCFLDEVDAPLDDANVARYTGMVKALSNKTQFILITHNHNTMAVADSLYGVTMQEYGVSSVLSVRLEQDSRAGR